MRLTHVPGPGPTLVLIHGASGCGSTWDRAAWDWADLWIADLPGRGAAIDEAPLDTMSALADDLAAALPASEAIWLVGHSLGGGIALQLLLDLAGLPVAGLALLSSSARLGVSPAILDAVRTSTPEAPFRLSFAFGSATSNAHREAYDAATAGVSAAASLADWTACDGFDVRHRLAEITVPTLVVWGDQDVLTPPKHQERMVEALGASAVVLPGLGHMAPFEDASAVATSVRGWIDEGP